MEDIKQLNYFENKYKKKLIKIMDYPFEDKTALKHTVTAEETKEQSPEQLIYNHDIKIQELDTRLRSLENLVNEMHNKVAPVWWSKQ